MDADAKLKEEARSVLLSARGIAILVKVLQVYSESASAETFVGYSCSSASARSVAFCKSSVAEWLLAEAGLPELAMGERRTFVINLDELVKSHTAPPHIVAWAKDQHQGCYHHAVAEVVCVPTFAEGDLVVVV